MIATVFSLLCASSYAIVIGVNEAPSLELRPLRYADDDAVRYARFFAAFGDVHLLTVPDAATERRHRATTRASTWDEVRAAVRAIAAKVERDHNAVFYFVYSGHGAANAQGAMALHLMDGDIDQAALLREIIAPVRSRETHVIIDACHAEAIVLGRGEREGRLVDVAPLTLPPHVGTLLASSSAQESHEWSRIEAGVFSHELLSGLAGPADINRDGRIEYSEISAFMAAANRELRDPRAVPSIVAAPPKTAPHAALVDFSRGAMRSFSRVPVAKRFFVELETGERLLDAHVAEPTIVRLPQRRAFVRTDEEEAEIVDERPLVFTPRTDAARGSIDDDLRAGLFAAPFSESYYRGYVDSAGIASVRFTRRDLPLRGMTWRQPTATTAWALAGASFAAAGISWGFAISAKIVFDATSYQRDALAAARRFDLARDVAIGTTIAAAALATAGFAIYPWIAPLRDGFAVGARIELPSY